MRRQKCNDGSVSSIRTPLESLIAKKIERKVRVIWVIGNSNLAYALGPQTQLFGCFHTGSQCCWADRAVCLALLVALCLCVCVCTRVRFAEELVVCRCGALKFDKASTRAGAVRTFGQSRRFVSVLALAQYLFTSSGKSNNAPKLKSPTKMPKWTAKLKTKTQS